MHLAVSKMVSVFSIGILYILFEHHCSVVILLMWVSIAINQNFLFLGRVLVNNSTTGEFSLVLDKKPQLKKNEQTVIHMYLCLRFVGPL